jgi:hypothetical protein
MCVCACVCVCVCVCVECEGVGEATRAASRTGQGKGENGKMGGAGRGGTASVSVYLRTTEANSATCVSSIIKTNPSRTSPCGRQVSACTHACPHARDGFLWGWVRKCDGERLGGFAWVSRCERKAWLHSARCLWSSAVASESLTCAAPLLGSVVHIRFGHPAQARVAPCATRCKH